MHVRMFTFVREALHVWLTFDSTSLKGDPCVEYGHMIV